MHSLGINIGSSSVKVTMLQGHQILWSDVVAHEGNFQQTLLHILERKELPKNLKTLVTGTEGRFLIDAANVIEALCIEEALKTLDRGVNAYVSLGGEDLVVYTVDGDQRIVNSFSGNKCASGTGEFFKQQLARMDMTLEDIDAIPPESEAKKLSTRCSVFMKSDCTHKLNKREATKGDIVVSLSEIMTLKVGDFLTRARISSGRVMLAGGVTANKFFVRSLNAHFPRIEFIITEQSPYMEAYGAALLAQRIGSVLPRLENLIRGNQVRFERYGRLAGAEGMVTYIPARRGKVKAGGEYILGVDGGSTTTKACLIDMETKEITAAFYGRTHGDPVKALKNCLVEIQSQVRGEIGDEKIRVTLASTTGSSREILGVFLETPAIYNEIIAHAVGTTFYNPDIDTIFEIGGQDAKYAYLKNMVPIDYAMNEACSAGTGSFLEESASGDLNIKHAWEIGEIALRAPAPLKFGEHCSAFINSDIRKAIQQGASREDITAGIVTSIVSNYLNRVVGNRTIGNTVVLQGGVAKNKAVPPAFAMLLNKKIIIPPEPELMGCFGVGLLALQKLDEGLLTKSEFDLDLILKTEITYERTFKCGACDNYCPINVLNVNGNRYMFGGRCDKYANIRKKRVFDEGKVRDYVKLRGDLLFKECAPDPASLKLRREMVVGIPGAFSVHTLYPLYSWFFHELGVRTVLSTTISREGTVRVESAYCFPAEIAHGVVQDIADHEVDFIFVPHFKTMPSYETDVHATICPITQALPYYIKKAFPEIPPEKFLSPIIHFKYGSASVRGEFIKIARHLGFSETEGRRAFQAALGKQQEYFQKASALGREALQEARGSKRPVIAVLGRPYNAFTPEANMGIPRKFTSRGYTVVPFDILPYEGKEIFPNMYWYYGQQDMKATRLIKEEDNIFLTWITNFSCAPDSFMLHYLKWMMGIKPFLILELDSHSADAGIDTRVEAFLDIIDGYRSKITKTGEERYDNGLRFIANGNDLFSIKNENTGEIIPVKNNPKVRLLLSNMGRLSAELVAASLRSEQIDAEAMPVPDSRVLQLARDNASGKECVPALLVLGSALAFFSSDRYRKDEIYLLFVPMTTGPCRTGQYYVFYRNLFRDLRLENVLVVILNSDNSYNGFGPDFSRKIWWSLTTADYMKDIETSLRACASDPAAAMKHYDETWRKLIKVAETDIRQVIPVLREIASEVKAIPLREGISSRPRVLIVGEIYVRRDDFAVDEIIGNLSQKGIIGKVTGITEWIYYCDFLREYEIREKLGRVPLVFRLFSRHFRDFLVYKVEQWWKHGVENRIKETLGLSGLCPDHPHDMYRIMGNSRTHFVDYALDSEISVSSGSAASAMLDGYSGVINISPFTCLIGRVIEGVITPWFRERGFPVLSVEIDGNLFPPGVINKLDIFMLNVLRFRSHREVVTLADRVDEERPAVGIPV